MVLTSHWACHAEDVGYVARRAVGHVRNANTLTVGAEPGRTGPAKLPKPTIPRAGSARPEHPTTFLGVFPTDYFRSSSCSIRD